MRRIFVLSLLVLSVLLPLSGTDSTVPHGHFHLADDWNQVGNATVDLDTPGWNQVGNATAWLDMERTPQDEILGNFTETCQDDVLLFPDLGDIVTSGNVSGSETHDYTYMSEDDANYWATSGNYMYFDIEDCIATTVYVSYDCISSSPLGKWLKLYLYNPSGDDLLIDADFDSSSNDAIIDNDMVVIEDWIDYSYNGRHTFFYNSTQPAIRAYYFHVDIYNDTSYYFESFAYTSDCTAYSHEAGDSYSTDGDVLNMEFDGTWDHVYCDSPSISVTGSYYLEARFRCNKTSGVDFRIYLYTQDARSGSSQVISLTESTSWTTYKVYITLSTVECVELVQAAGSSVLTQFDYLRIAPADEFGWCHDGSTTEGIDTLSASISTNGNHLNCTAGQNVEHVIFNIDTTSTACKISTTYYQFLEFSVTDVFDSDGDGVFGFRVFTDGSTYSAFQGYYSTNGVYRYNIQSLGISDIQYVKFYIKDIGEYVGFDYMRLYSIANWTVVQDGCGVDDYLYVDDDALISSMTSGYFVLDYDPSFFHSPEYRVWDMTLDYGTAELAGYVGYWDDYEEGPSGEFPIGFNVTDIRLRFNESAGLQYVTFTLGTTWLTVGEAVAYIDMIGWEEIVNAIIRLTVPSADIGYWFVLIGICLIIVSPLFLVYGGRESMSRDKLFIFLILIIVGWGLFLGGIF